MQNGGVDVAVVTSPAVISQLRALTGYKKVNYVLPGIRHLLNCCVGNAFPSLPHFRPSLALANIKVVISLERLFRFSDCCRAAM